MGGDKLIAQPWDNVSGQEICREDFRDESLNLLQKHL